MQKSLYRERSFASCSSIDHEICHMDSSCVKGIAKSLVRLKETNEREPELRQEIQRMGFGTYPLCMVSHGVGVAGRSWGERHPSEVWKARCLARG